MSKRTQPTRKPKAAPSKRHESQLWLLKKMRETIEALPTDLPVVAVDITWLNGAEVSVDLCRAGYGPETRPALVGTVWSSCPGEGREHMIEADGPGDDITYVTAASGFKDVPWIKVVTPSNAEIAVD